MGWTTTVDGLVLPKQIAGHAALELVNTYAGWGEDVRSSRDYLETYGHLTTLAQLSGVLDEDRSSAVRRLADRRPDGARQVLERTRTLREDLHDVLVGTATGVAADRLGSAITQARAQQHLHLADGTARWRFVGRPALAEPLSAFLVEAGDLLVGAPRTGACPGHGCGWLFLNPSGRRRWCQMAVCGNRAKQASHAARARTTEP